MSSKGRIKIRAAMSSLPGNDLMRLEEQKVPLFCLEKFCGRENQNENGGKLGGVSYMGTRSDPVRERNRKELRGLILGWSWMP